MTGIVILWHLNTFIKSITEHIILVTNSTVDFRSACIKDIFDTIIDSWFVCDFYAYAIHNVIIKWAFGTSKVWTIDQTIV